MKVYFIVAIVIVAVFIVIGAISRAKKERRKAFAQRLEVEFMNLKSNAKAINEPYIRESCEYLMNDAMNVKDPEDVRVALLNILDKYNEAGKISKDGFYAKAHDLITK